MTPERYRRIGEIYHAALEVEAEERAAFLADSCAGDDALRYEVESLIASHEQASGFIGAPALTVAARLLADSEKDALIGHTVGRYKILSLLGAGGMGRVYLAEDTELGRRVALKFLPEYFTYDQNQAQRFRQEARAASALNHPNILTVYEVGQVNGREFIAAEYVEGETLRQRLTHSPIKISELLDVAIQITSALSAAHQIGIIHRDIKPDNIMLRHDGLIKVLDFGLVKLTRREATPTDLEAATRAMVATNPGVVMGTIHYMSPEQALGRVNEIDHRSDIFSFGCILYEAVAGRRPFEGESNIESLHKTVYEPAPSLRELNSSVPLELQRIVSRCLMKDPKERYQTINEVATELRELQRELDSGLHNRAPASLPGASGVSDTSGTRAQASVITGAGRGAASGVSVPQSTSSAEYLVNEIKRHKWHFFIVLSLIVAVLLGIGFGVDKFLGRNGAVRSGAPLRVTPLTSSPYIERSPAFSPDGKEVAYVWTGENNDNSDIYVKLIGAGEPLRLTTNPAPDMSPAFSPDGRYVAFLRGRGEGKGFYIIPALGGAERKLADAYEWTGYSVRPRVLDWSPDGKTLAVVDKTSEDEPWSIFLISIETGERRRLTQSPAGYEGDAYVCFSPDGARLAFVRSNFVAGNIYTIAVAGGEPVRITSDESSSINGLAWSPDGTGLVFSSDRSGGDSSLWRVAAGGGTPTPVAGAGENIYELSNARQGDRLAYAQLQLDYNMYRVELMGQPGRRSGASAPVSFNSSTRLEDTPMFSPDGRKIAFTSNRSGSDELWVCDADGKNSAQLTNFGGPHTHAPGWSPDGRFIAFASLASGNGDVYVIGADGGSPRRLTTDPSAELEPRWSRDGQWIYFTSNRTGRFEVWKMPAAGGAAIQLTRGGGQNAAESPDGRTVYFLRGEGELGLWQVSTEGGEETQVFAPRVAAWNWAAVERGIYFLTPQAGHYELRFFDFATHQTTQVATIEPPSVMSFISALTVSPDEHWVVYAQRDKVDFDLMLVENFR